MPLTYTFPPYLQNDLSNGMHITWLSHRMHPVLTVTLLFPVGRVHAPLRCEGITEITANLILKGPKSMSYEKFSELWEHTGASLFSEVKEEYTLVGVRTLVHFADTIVPLFWEMLCEPALNEEEFKRIRKETVTGLQTEFADPSIIAGKHFHAELFGSDNPAGRNPGITSVQRLSIGQIRKFYADNFGPRGAYCIIAGDHTVEAMRRSWEPLIVSWKKENIPPQWNGAPNGTILRNRIRVVDKPELSQTTVVMGHNAVPELHEKKLALAIANYILGGGNFSSRLMARIRSETGQTYGIASQIAGMKNYGVFTISTTTQNNQVSSVVKAIRDVYGIFTREGATPDEILKAKQFALGNIAFELEGINNVVEKLLWLQYFKRDKQYIESFESLLQPIDAAYIREALQHDFYSPGFVIVAVGRKKEIAGVLEELGEISYFHCRQSPYRC